MIVKSGAGNKHQHNASAAKHGQYVPANLRASQDVNQKSSEALIGGVVRGNVSQPKESSILTNYQ